MTGAATPERPNLLGVQERCESSCCAPAEPAVRDRQWHRAAGWARLLSWVSVAWMATEGAVGLWQGFAAGSIGLVGWALGSVVEGAASVAVVWRFTGSRTLSPSAERRAQQAVAISFWLLAPYVTVESVLDLIGRRHVEPTVVGMALTGSALLVMPLLGRVKHTLGDRLGSAATTGEGTQNYLCAVQAGAVLVGLGVTAAWPGFWWLDPIVGLGVAAAAVWQGVRSWRGEDCGC